MRILLNLFLFFSLISKANAHTNSVGFSISTNNSDPTKFDVEAFFGSWHSNNIPAEGRAILYSLDDDGDSTEPSDYNVVAYGDNDDTSGDNEYIFTRGTTTGSISFSNENGTNCYTKSQITTAGFTPGTDYFWVTSAGVLIDTNVGANNCVYNHQSAVILAVAPGTYRLDYEEPKPSSATWRPEPGVDTVLFTVNSDGSVVVAAPPSLSSSTPADNATNVSLSANIVLTFSEAVDVETGNITIKKKKR